MKLTNNKNIGLPLAVWLMHDMYDFKPGSKKLSATTLLKPTKSIILSLKYPKQTADLEDIIAARRGTAIHDSIEKAWVENANELLKLAGYKKHDRIVVITEQNKDLVGYDSNSIPVWIEIRSSKKINGYEISGKFDMCFNGHLIDFKTTSVYTAIYDSHKEDYILQGSIYRWLNPGIITDDFIEINWIFTDWSKSEAEKNSNYPQCACMSKKYPLLSLEETEKFILNKLHEIDKFYNMNQQDMPVCTKEELWCDPPKYKYYSNPETAMKGGRATKVFGSMLEAQAFKANNNNKGVVMTVTGSPKRCKYCNAYDSCEQRKKYFSD